MLNYFRKRKHETSLDKNHVGIVFTNTLDSLVTVRCEDDTFDYIRTFKLASGQTVIKNIKKGAAICVWMNNVIIGEYLVKTDKDTDLEILIE